MVINTSQPASWRLPWPRACDRCVPRAEGRGTGSQCLRNPDLHGSDHGLSHPPEKRPLSGVGRTPPPPHPLTQESPCLVGLEESSEVGKLRPSPSPAVAAPWTGMGA